MKLWTLLGILLSLLISSESYAQIYIVPFQNLSLNPNGRILASFAFGSRSVMFCFANDMGSVVNISWPFNGRIFSGVLPILLKTRANFEGQFCDPTGNLTLTNTNGIAQVSCVFAY